jgi:hypothetical protein
MREGCHELREMGIVQKNRLDWRLLLLAGFDGNAFHDF